MPSVAQEELIIPSCKKRRRDEDGSVEVHLPFPQQVHDDSSLFTIVKDNHARIFQHGGTERPPHCQSPLSRRILPLPVAKKMRIASEIDDCMRSRSNSPTISRQSKHSTPASTSREELQETSANSRPQPSRAGPGPLLSRCHICHRKPAKKSDLDSFADCQGCGERTCYVCIRECLGWRRDATQETPVDEEDPIQFSQDPDLTASFHMEDVGELSEDRRFEGFGINGRGNQAPGRPRNTKGNWVRGGHRQTVCSRCCVERGLDGDVVCLGCLPFIDGL